MTLTIKEAKEKHEKRLMDLPGVVSVGIGKGEGDNKAIIVGVDGLHPAIIEKFPQTLEGYPVQVKELRKIKAY